MKPRNEEQKFSKLQVPAKKPRFRIEKLEERIAPSHRGRHGFGPSYGCRGRNCFP
jgi:hypothetical protein